MDSYNANVLDVAAWIVQKAKQDEEAGDLMTHLKLQKLLYYAQAWIMVFTGKSLFEDEFEAWTHGPVSRRLWTALTGAGRAPIEEVPDGDADSITDTEITEVLDDVWLIYGSKSAKFLEKLSHAEQPWLIARGDLPLEAPCQVVIEKENMRNFYEQLNRTAQQAN
ncbi:Panacea domain-containing protein [Hymenobacter psychrotolerans]|uniref:Panacea domain-containing protein n=1 Tax=Hymenobacter psychrotolerans TaxID=344998 RepID=UPI0009330D63|nr:type II toxin-antitoxin system antitoxin SocA domain-containing protein [Hymenobacter psychrotolerans]